MSWILKERRERSHAALLQFTWMLVLWQGVMCLQQNEKHCREVDQLLFAQLALKASFSLFEPDTLILETALSLVTHLPKLFCLNKRGHSLYKNSPFLSPADPKKRPTFV